MQDRKAVRRRRAALAVFVALSLVVLTAYFGESGGGLFHSMQRGAQESFAPIESGATTVGLVQLQRKEGFPQGTEPVTARVIARSSTSWYSGLKIDKGASDGVKLDQPAIAAGGMAGKITRVTGGTAEVTLITDGSSAVSAQIMPRGAAGVVKPEVGDPDDMLLDFVQAGNRVTEGTTVVTSGFRSGKVESLFPRGIPIGRVTKVDLDELELFQRVHIRPFADLGRIDIVQVLTRRGRGTQTAGVITP